MEENIQHLSSDVFLIYDRRNHSKWSNKFFSQLTFYSSAALPAPRSYSW